VVGTNDYDQGGARLDFNASARDQMFARVSYSGGYDYNPVSVRGTTVPGFPTRDDLKTDSGELSSTHIFSPSLTNSLRGTFLRYPFDFDLRLNQTPPSALGFDYPSSNTVGQGPPFFNVVGYSPVGGAITGPRDSVQNSFEGQEGLSWIEGRHSLKFGAEYLCPAVHGFRAESLGPRALRAELELRHTALAARPLPARAPLRRRERDAPAAQHRGQPSGIWAWRDRGKRGPAPYLCGLPGRWRAMHVIDCRGACRYHQLDL
jgi:hypothetical protein